MTTDQVSPRFAMSLEEENNLTLDGKKRADDRVPRRDDPWCDRTDLRAWGLVIGSGNATNPREFLDN